MCAKVTSTYMEFTLAFGPKLEFSFSFKCFLYFCFSTHTITPYSNICSYNISCIAPIFKCFITLFIVHYSGYRIPLRYLFIIQQLLRNIFPYYLLLFVTSAGDLLDSVKRRRNLHTCKVPSLLNIIFSTNF